MQIGLNAFINNIISDGADIVRQDGEEDLTGYFVPTLHALESSTTESNSVIKQQLQALLGNYAGYLNNSIHVYGLRHSQEGDEWELRFYFGLLLSTKALASEYMVRSEVPNASVLNVSSLEWEEVTL